MMGYVFSWRVLNKINEEKTNNADIENNSWMLKWDLEVEHVRAHRHPKGISDTHQMHLCFCLFPEFVLGRVCKVRTFSSVYS